VLTPALSILLATMLLTSCASNSSNIKIYSISKGNKKPLKQLTLIGVGDCRDNSVRIKYIDNKRISNNDYSAVAFKPGLHQFTVDIDDEKLNNKDLKQRFNIQWKRVVRNISLEPGKFYLVCPIQKHDKEWTFWLEERHYEFEYYYKYRDNIDYV
jgi:hypothetical protein